jgi:DMSO reductase iron-sulfur subunit
MAQLGFSFDANKCTGCNACQIACIIESQLDFSEQWRQVVTFNNRRHPDLPVFHISLACNHCADPPCMKYCPALAYSKDPASGIVRLDEKKCIGCHYCSWVCPYDAPRYRQDSGLMTKCTLCQNRLDEKLEPACVSLCPTDALNLKEFEKLPDQKTVPGFTKSKINPSLEIIQLEAGRKIPQADSLPFDSSVIEKFKSSPSLSENKTNLKSEWTLLIFTLLVPILVAFFAVSRVGEMIVIPEILIGSGILGMVISSWHLGKKYRAYRAIFNWQNSWLSREIISYGIFLTGLVITEFIFTTLSAMTWVTVLSGIITLISIDMVYVVIPKVTKNKLHSAQVLFSGLLYFSLLEEYQIIFFLIICIKAFLFLKRMTNENSIWSFFSISRIVLGFLLPVLLWIFGIEGLVILGSLLIAGVLDRVNFYQRLDIISPARQMEMDYRDLLSESDLPNTSSTEL